jgi:hypothetical protein
MHGYMLEWEAEAVDKSLGMADDADMRQESQGCDGKGGCGEDVREADVGKGEC